MIKSGTIIKLISRCCGAEVKLQGKSSYDMHYVCSKCGYRCKTDKKEITNNAEIK